MMKKEGPPYWRSRREKGRRRACSGFFPQPSVELHLRGLGAPVSIKQEKKELDKPIWTRRNANC